MKKYTPISMVKNGRYVFYHQELSKDDQTIILEKIQNLINENQEYCDKINFDNLCNLFYTISAYQLLITKNKTKEEAISILSNAMYSFLTSSKEKYEKLFKSNLFFFLARIFIPKMMVKQNGHGWILEKNEGDKKTIKFTCHLCLMKTICDKYNVSFLTPIFCGADLYQYNNLPYTSFHRHETLGKGGTKCDFMFKRHDKGEQIEREENV